jgi:hypothetical protein
MGNYQKQLHSQSEAFRSNNFFNSLKRYTITQKLNTALYQYIYTTKDDDILHI